MKRFCHLHPVVRTCYMCGFFEWYHKVPGVVFSKCFALSLNMFFYRTSSRYKMSPYKYTIPLRHGELTFWSIQQLIKVRTTQSSSTIWWTYIRHVHNTHLLSSNSWKYHFSNTLAKASDLNLTETQDGFDTHLWGGSPASYHFFRWGKHVSTSDLGCFASACSLHFASEVVQMNVCMHTLHWNEHDMNEQQPAD